MSIINSNNNLIRSLQNSIQEYQDFLSNDVSADLTTAKDQLEKLILDKSDLYNEKMIRNERYSYNSAMTEMLKDTGIKTKIINKNITKRFIYLTNVIIMLLSRIFINLFWFKKIVLYLSQLKKVK